jgi:hypothetical protein
MNATTRTAVERAMIALADADTALQLATAAVRSKLSTALGQLATVREAFDLREHEVRLVLEEQAQNDARVARSDAEFSGDSPDAWFESWLHDEGEHATEPLTLAEARVIYFEAFKRALGEADHG